MNPAGTHFICLLLEIERLKEDDDDNDYNDSRKEKKVEKEYNTTNTTKDFFLNMHLTAFVEHLLSFRPLSKLLMIGREDMVSVLISVLSASYLLEKSDL